MSYDKDLINKLFINYVEIRSEFVLGELLEACKPMIEVVLSKYSLEFRSHFDDMAQDICIKLVISLRKNLNLMNYCQNPVSYLFFKVRLFARVVSDTYRKLFDMGNSLTGVEEQILIFREEEKLSFKEISKRMKLIEPVTKSLYKTAKRKQNMVKLNFANIHESRDGTFAADILGRIGINSYSLDPMQQMITKEIVQETWQDCIEMIREHGVYKQDKRLLIEIEKRLADIFERELGIGDLL